MTKTPSREWLIEETAYAPEKELYWETVFALSNGYMAARGSLDENHFCPDIQSYFGTYVAGIFDKYQWDYQAIVNLADFFNCALHVNGELLDLSKARIENYSRYLDMYNGILVRRFTWTTEQGEKTDVEITRFISKADPHLAIQHYRFTPSNYDGEIRLTNVLDGNVSNIDFHVSGYQLRDEKYYFMADEHEVAEIDNGGYLMLKTKTTQHRICELFRFAVSTAGDDMQVDVVTDASPRKLQQQAAFTAMKGKTYEFFKTVAVYTSNDPVNHLLHAAESKTEDALQKGYQALLEEHSAAWNAAWEVSDVRIEGDERDQRNVRFNIYHLIQMGNKDNPRVNIGSRGLTSEMHYGNCFWDTEIFILPFFIYTDPEKARALVQYRHETLPAAREKAKVQCLEGAMYPWMSSYPGSEQADYWEYANIAVHIVSDVAYGLMHYFEATGDETFMLDYGLEILIETARFWASRVGYDESKQGYTLTLVKGPNEYGIVDNNTYTNWNARWNLAEAYRILEWALAAHPEKTKALTDRLKLDSAEPAKWASIAAQMYINYDAERDLYVEDDSILGKKPVDLKSLKPGRKITTELGHPWDMLLRLKIVKQADVLLLMYLHRSEFTKEQIKKAWNFYEPITLHDSSLSYNTHSIIANELGMKEKSEDYFQQTARLDLEDVMENTFLGIHSANAGGTWQCVINGFAGMRRERNKLSFSPSLPARWNSLHFKVFFRGVLLVVDIVDDKVTITPPKKGGTECRIEQNAVIFEPLAKPREEILA